MRLRKRPAPIPVDDQHAREFEARMEAFFIDNEEQTKRSPAVRLAGATAVVAVVLGAMKLLEAWNVSVAYLAIPVVLALIAERVREARRRKRLTSAAGAYGLLCRTCGSLLSFPKQRATDLIGEDLEVADKPADHVLATGRCYGCDAPVWPSPDRAYESRQDRR